MEPSTDQEGRTMFSVITLSALGAIAVWGAVASIVVTARDGYRAVPTRSY